jgi:hypothetical protein
MLINAVIRKTLTKFAKQHPLKMPRISKYRLTLTEERDEALYDNYHKVITSHGTTARFIAKSELYREAAEPFFITPGSARNIIQRLMRKKSKPENVGE